MFDEVQTHRLIGSLDGHSFTEADVKNVNWSGICSNQDVMIGSAAISKLTLTFLNPILSRGEWEGKIITISDGTRLANSTYEDILFGTFWISEAEWTNIGTVEVVAYDCLSLMDEDITFVTSSGQIYNWLKWIELQTGVTLGMTQQECEALPNGTETFVLSADNDIKTYRDLLSKLAQLVGGFGVALSNGSFTIKSFNNTSLLSIPLNRRKKNAKYSDFTTRFDYMSYIDMESGEKIYFGNQAGYGMDIGENPFLQYGIEETRDREATAIWNVIQNMNYTPYTVSLLPSFCVLELGDVVTFVDDYTGNNSSGSIMSMTWTYGQGVKLQCYGSKPNLKKAKSSTDNAVNGLKARKNQGGIIYHPYSNVSPIVITTTPTKLFEYDFLATEQTSVMLEYNLKMLNEFTDENQTVTLYYYVNGEKVSYEPMDTYSESDEYHIYPGFYWLLNLTGGSETVFEVWAETDNGTAFINAGDIHAMLWGQKLYAQQGGQIPDLSDEYELTPMPNPIPIGMTDEVELDTDYHPTPIGDYLDLENGTYLELEGGGYMELESGGN